MATRPYLRKKHVTIKLYDASTPTPKSLIISGYSDIPEISEPILDVAPEQYVSQGTFRSIEEADDALTYTEFNLPIDVLDSQVTANKNAIDQWMNFFKDVAGIALTSTNDGSAQIRNNKTHALVSTGLSTAWKTCGLKVLFDNSATGKAFGKDFKYVQPLSARFSTAGHAQVTLNFRILCAGTDISSI